METFGDASRFIKPADGGTSYPPWLQEGFFLTLKHLMIFKNGYFY